MRVKLCNSLVVFSLLVSSATVLGAVTHVGESYNTGTWTGSVDTETYTGNGPNAKVWEYENVLFPNAWNTETPDVNTADPCSPGALPAFFTHKYVADRYFNKIDQIYVDGFMKDDTPGVEVYIDISPDNVNWTRVWSLENEPALSWITYFGYWEPASSYRWVTDTGKTFTFPATKTLYVKHGVNFCRQCAWQMLGSASYSGVKLYRVDGPPTTCEEAKAMDFVITEDLNGDCRVNIGDIAILASHWLNCIVPDEAGCATPWIP